MKTQAFPRSPVPRHGEVHRTSVIADDDGVVVVYHMLRRHADDKKIVVYASVNNGDRVWYCDFVVENDGRFRMAESNDIFFPVEPGSISRHVLERAMEARFQMSHYDRTRLPLVSVEPLRAPMEFPYRVCVFSSGTGTP